MSEHPAEAVTDPDTGIVYFPDDTPNPRASPEKDAPECNCESMGGRFGAHRPECPWQVAFEAHVAENDVRFRWDLQTDDGGLPVHLPMGVTQDGQGPTQDSEAHHYLCCCGDPKCPLNDALHLAWESGTRVFPPAPADERPTDDA